VARRLSPAIRGQPVAGIRGQAFVIRGQAFVASQSQAFVARQSWRAICEFAYKIPTNGWPQMHVTNGSPKWLATKAGHKCLANDLWFYGN